MAAGSEDLKASAKADYVAGRYQDAVVKYSDLIEKSDSEDSDLHVYYSNRAACYQQLKQNQDALSDAQSCVAFKPSFTKGHSRLATILATLNRHREAVLAWERALELEPANASIRNSVNMARRKAGMPPSSDASADGGFGGGGGAFGTGLFQNFGRAFSGMMGGQQGGLVSETITRLIGAFASASTEMKVGYGLGAAFLVYYIFKTVYSWLFPPYMYYDDDVYVDDYGSSSSSYGGAGYGYGGGSRGLSWTTWGLVMGAAYYLPPLFPQVLGFQYAQPFFGMSWTTFMWLLRMVTSGGGGGMGLGGPGGMFGGGRRRRF